MSAGRDAPRQADDARAAGLMSSADALPVRVGWP